MHWMWISSIARHYSRPPQLFLDFTKGQPLLAQYYMGWLGFLNSDRRLKIRQTASFFC